MSCWVIRRARGPGTRCGPRCSKPCLAPAPTAPSSPAIADGTWEGVQGVRSPRRPPRTATRAGLPAAPRGPRMRLMRVRSPVPQHEQGPLVIHDNHKAPCIAMCLCCCRCRSLCRKPRRRWGRGRDGGRGRGRGRCGAGPLLSRGPLRCGLATRDGWRCWRWRCVSRGGDRHSCMRTTRHCSVQ